MKILPNSRMGLVRCAVRLYCIFHVAFLFYAVTLSLVLWGAWTALGLI